MSHGGLPPLLDEQGRLILTNRGEMRLIPRAVCLRSSAPSVQGPQITHTNANDMPLPRYWEAGGDNFAPIRMVGVCKAVASMAGGETPGPPGLPMGLFKILDSLYPYLLLLLGTIYRKGYIPTPPLGIRVVPLPKPREDPMGASQQTPSLIAQIHCEDPGMHHAP